MDKTVVYVIDDDPLVTESLGAALRLETPHHVEVFQSADAALRRLTELPPDVALTDFKMPAMDGLALLRAIRKSCPDAVLILLTGYADKESAIHAINEVGIYQYVEKPWDLRDLLLKIEAGLERQELVRRLRQANADLERRNRDLLVAQDRLVAAERLGAVGRVVSGIAHEIGNQLALVGYAEAIKARSSDRPQVVELADVIVTAQKRLAAMVGEIRDFVRGQGEIALEPADVASVLEEALAILRYDRDVARCRLVRELRARPLARLHRGKYGQVVINLVRNAAQASTGQGEVRVVLEEQASQVRLVVEDFGAGMAPEVVARLGEPFFSTRGDRGTGLGVGICRHILREHGGDLVFESMPGKGTRAIATVPALEERS